VPAVRATRQRWNSSGRRCESTLKADMRYSSSDCRVRNPLVRSHAAGKPGTDPPGARSPGVPAVRGDVRADRPSALHQREDREHARVEPPQEDRHVEPDRAGHPGRSQLSHDRRMTAAPLTTAGADG
jgi:hypothetical protein